MALDERDLFTEKAETRPGRYLCPRCRREGEYSIRWVRRSKKDRLPAGADEGDRAKFAKVRDYLLRLDDEVEGGGFDAADSKNRFGLEVQQRFFGQKLGTLMDVFPVAEDHNRTP